MDDFLDRLGAELARAASSPAARPALSENHRGASEDGFLERLGGELTHAFAATRVRHTATPMTARRRRRRRLPVRSRRALLALAAALVLATGAAIATRSRWLPSSSPPEAGRSPAVLPSPAALRSFAILRRPLQAGDEVPTRTQLTLSGASGANLLLARRAHAPGIVGAWVIPGRGSVCLGVEYARREGGAACAVDARAIAGRLLMFSPWRSPAGRVLGETLAGLVPDGVARVRLTLADGSTNTVAVHDNVYATRLTHTYATSVQFTRAGVRVKIAHIALPFAPGR
jgi:hypothetical protein